MLCHLLLIYYNQKGIDEMQSKIVDIYNLTPMQKGMLYHHLIDDSSKQYIEQVRVRINEKLNIDVLKESVKILVHNHEVLRTKFVYEDIDNPVQIVFQDVDTNVEFTNLENLDEDKINDVINDCNNIQIEKGFDLSKDCLQRIAIYKVQNNEYYITWTFHHIIMDGWSLEKIIHEFIDIYIKLLNGERIIRTNKAPFREYVTWLEEKDYGASLEYWKNYLAGYSSRVIIPKYVDEIIGGKQRSTYDFYVNDVVTSKIIKFINSEKVTFSNFMHAIWGVILQKYNGTNDVVFGSVITNRPSDIEDINETVGIFINTVPCRVQCSADCSFKDILFRLRDEIGNNMEHAHVGLWDIQKESELGNMLIDNILVLENFTNDNNATTMSPNILELESTEVTNYDLDINIYIDEQIKFRINYNPMVYGVNTFCRLENHMKNIIKQVVENSSIKVSDIELQSQSEILEEIKLFNNNKIELPMEERVHTLFEKIAASHPEKVAVQMKEEVYTYGELNRRANIFARQLVGIGIEKDKTVAVLMKRSMEMMVAILAIWKAGGAYIPIELDYPEERINNILNDSGCTVTVVDNNLTKDLLKEKYLYHVLNIKECLDLEMEYNFTNLNIDVGINDLAYVIYTSGSTGKPKGAMLEHAGMLNHMLAKVRDMHLNENSIVAQTASHCFDISVWQFFVALICGGKTVIYDNETVLAAPEFIDEIIKDSITILELVPTYLEVFVKTLNQQKLVLQNLRYLLVTGEEVKSKLVAEWFQICPNIFLVNAYGPTEASDDITHFIMSKYSGSEQIPVGYPINNLNIYIVDENMRLCPIGVKGEILVSGIGVGRGYLNDLDKTNKAFGLDPFTNNKYKIYKTGDIGRWKSTGVIDYYGRKDFQVKIRGFRIELGEIESSLLSIGGIDNAIVLDKTDKEGRKYLCAYITTNCIMEICSVKTLLGTKLPDYMVPQQFVVLDEFPITINGKIDRKALQKYQVDFVDDHNMKKVEINNTKELTEEQLVLLDVWKQTFNNQSIDIFDNFFAIGGDSISAIQITSNLIKKGFRLSVAELLKYATIEKCSEFMKKEIEEIDQKPVQGPVELTAIQCNFMEEVYKEGQHYNQSLLLHCLERVEIDKLENTLQLLLTHHDGLRMQYELLDDTIFQFNQGIQNLNCRIKKYDLTMCNSVKDEILYLSGLLQRSIKLNGNALFKAEVYSTKDGDYIYLVAHHMIVDGISWRIILEDLEAIYSQLLLGKMPHLPNKTVSFKKWAEGIRAFCNEETLDKEISYWTNLKNYSTKRLPVDYTISERFASDISSVKACLSGSETDHLVRDVSLSYNTDINDILLAALSETLTKYLNDSDILLHLEGHGREPIGNMNISRTVGWFTSLFPVVLKKSSLNGTSELIINTKETLRRIPNKGIGYGLLRYIRNETRIVAEQEPEIIFNYLGQFDHMDSNLFKVTSLPTAADKGDLIEEPYKIYFNSYISEGCFNMEVKYNRNEYELNTMNKLIETYMEDLRNIILHCLNKVNPTYTASDFDSNDLSSEDLDIILGALQN